MDRPAIVGLTLDSVAHCLRWTSTVERAAEQGSWAFASLMH